eukprot:3485525-Pyramimonas_sp.AAC.1
MVKKRKARPVAGSPDITMRRTNRKRSSGGVAAKTAPASPPAMALCALVSCATRRDLQSGLMASP